MSANTQLDPRERLGLLLTLAVIILCAGLATYIPAGPRRAFVDSEQRLKSLQTDLQMAYVSKQEEELRLQRQAQIAEWRAARPANFELLAFLESTLVNTGIQRDRFALQSRPVPRSVGEGAESLVLAQIEMKNCELKEIIDLLYAIYANHNLVALYQLNWIRPAADQKGMDVNMELITLR